MENTKIEWCDHTFNPWVGCSPVSAGCDHCYAAAMSKWTGQDFSARRRTSAGYWEKPLKWNADAEKAGTRPLVFCGSMCDWLDSEAPADAQDDLAALITHTQNLFWLLLTKRPENLSQKLGCLPFDMSLYPNVGIGVTVENQAMADERIPLLLDIPARMRFVSVEPMLGPVDLRYPAFNGADSFGSIPGIDWVICGAETGPRARVMDGFWAARLAQQCSMQGIPFFFKKASKGHNVAGKTPRREFPEILKGAQHGEQE